MDLNKEEDYSKKYSLDYNKPAGLSLSRVEDQVSMQKSGEFDYKKGYQFQYYDEIPKY